MCLAHSEPQISVSCPDGDGGDGGGDEEEKEFPPEKDSNNHIGYENGVY